jgi:hypothetical protein
MEKLLRGGNEERGKSGGADAGYTGMGVDDRVRAGEPGMMGEMMTKEFMSGLDKVLGTESGVDMWFSTSAEDWEEYCEEVERLFDQFVYRKSFQEDEERQVRDQWRRKWDFVKMLHTESHFQRPLVLLTPSSVESLALALKKVSGSITEVSGHPFQT